MSNKTSDCALACGGATSRFGDQIVVDCVNLEVVKGEFVAMLGPGGCGKTTTLRLIAELDALDAGVITIGDRTVATSTNLRTWSMPPEQRRVGMVFHDYALFPHLSVHQNVGFGLDRRQQSAAADALELVGLAARANHMPAQLSGGQQQRVALGRALAPRPEIILMDEPFSNMDAGLRGRIR